jgi:hypothetical protein
MTASEGILILFLPAVGDHDMESLSNAKTPGGNVPPDHNRQVAFIKRWPPIQVLLYYIV